MQDGKIVQRHRIARRELGGAPPGRQRIIKPAERAVELADIAQIERRIGRQRHGALHQRQRLGQRLAAEGENPGEVQHVGLVRRGRQRMARQPLRLLQPAGPLELIGNGEDLAERDGDRDIRGHGISRLYPSRSITGRNRGMMGSRWRM